MIRALRSARRETRSLLWLAIFLFAVVGFGAFVGISCAPDAWYDQLSQPAFALPKWVFGPVWFALYVILALVGWTLWMKAPRDPAMILWAGQLAVNLLWPPTFFVLHLLWPALGLIVVMIALTVLLMSRPVVRQLLIDWSLVPYLTWLIVSALLNTAIAILN